MGWLAVLALAVPMAALLAWWPWRDSLDRPLARLAAAARFVGILGIILLLFDPGLRGRTTALRPLVLLDRSVSMLSGDRSPDSLAAAAAALGDTVPFGTLDGGEPAGPTLLADALTGAVGGGRPVVVITDGEIADAGLIPQDMLARASVTLVPRSSGADVGLTAIRAPERLAAGDTLTVEVDLATTASSAADVEVALRLDGTLLASSSGSFSTTGRARIKLELPWPANRDGVHWLELARVGEPDAEPGNDVRWWHLVVTPTPGIVMVAATPDWDARFLFTTLRDVSATTVRGYVMLSAGEWFRMDNLRPVALAEVMAAARQADLLVVRGDTTAWRTLGRARLLWPAGGTVGDWYADAGGLSPVAAALSGSGFDSLPALSAARSLPLPPDGWVGLRAQLARRGTAVPVWVGSVEGGGRRVTVGVQGLHRWAFRGGAAEQSWRALVAATTGWLLDSPPQSGARAMPVERSNPRGQPVRFRWSGTDAPQALPVQLESDGSSRVDTLRFDAAGEAKLVLPVGRYNTLIDGVAIGMIGVEPYSPEWMAGAVTLPAAEAISAPVPVRRSLRDLLPLLALVIAAFSTEWVLRRRLDLR